MLISIVFIFNTYLENLQYLCERNQKNMDSKTPFNKDNGTKISFEQLVKLIGTTCDYKFCIVDENIDDELMALAAKHGIDLTGYKHVIETSCLPNSLQTGIKKPLEMRGLTCVIAEGASKWPPLYVLIVNSFFSPFPQPTACKNTTKF